MSVNLGLEKATNTSQRKGPFQPEDGAEEEAAGEEGAGEAGCASSIGEP